MAQIDLKKKLILINIIYFGPPRCGKKTWVRYIHENARNPESLIEKSFENESSLCFLWDPWDGLKIDGFHHVFQFQSCSFDMDGKHPLSSKILCQADGLVFIAESVSFGIICRTFFGIKCRSFFAIICQCWQLYLVSASKNPVKGSEVNIKQFCHVSYRLSFL